MTAAPKDLILLDCTLRDGGYYTKWDFNKEIVDRYLEAMSKANVDIVELGTRRFSAAEFLGGHAFCTEEYLSTLKLPEDIEYAVMLDAKTIIQRGGTFSDAVEALFVNASLSPISIVRVAAHYSEAGDAARISEVLNGMGYRVVVNLMQSEGKSRQEITEATRLISQFNTVDVIYYADSLGNMSQESHAYIVEGIREVWSGPIGFHAHNNLGLAISNCIQSVKAGVRYLDATVTGMGRGAGNVETEYLLQQFPRDGGDQTELEHLVVEYFEPSKRQHGWGTSLLYFLGAKGRVHPTYIQNLAADSKLSALEKVQAVKVLAEGESSSFSDASLEAAIGWSKTADASFSYTAESVAGRFASQSVVLIGGGESVGRYQESIESYLKCKRMSVFALNLGSVVSDRLIDYFFAIKNSRFLSQGDNFKTRQKKLIIPKQEFSDHHLIPAIDYGVAIGDWQVCDTHAVIPFELTIAYALSFFAASGVSEVNLIGFDGYTAAEQNIRTQEVFDFFSKRLELIALTPSSYNIRKSSIYDI